MTGTLLHGLEGRVVVVSGGRSGIGAAVVQALQAHGARVAVLDVSLPEGEASADVQQLVCDVTSAEAVAAAVDAVVREHGGLDGLVQCAGIARDGVLWKLSDADWQAVLDVNLTGSFHLLRAVLPHLRARGGGAVVNVTSINGMRGKFGQGNYAASKAGLIALTKTAAREMGAFGVRVNAVAPGLVRTAMTADLPEKVVQRALDEAALPRMTETEDVAAAVLFLLSDLSKQITGETLRVDAGQYM